MSKKSGDSIPEAIFESANRLADDIDSVALKRMIAWSNEHSTTLKGAYLQDGFALVVCGVAWLALAGFHPVIDWTIVIIACFIVSGVAYRTIGVLS